MKFGGNGAATMEHHGCIRKYSELITFRGSINKDFRANDSLSKKKSDASLYFVLADIHRDNMDAIKRHQIMKLIGSLSIVMILQETRAASLGK